MFQLFSLDDLFQVFKYFYKKEVFLFSEICHNKLAHFSFVSKLQKSY